MPWDSVGFSPCLDKVHSTDPLWWNPTTLSAFSSKYLHWFSFSPFLSEVHKYIHTSLLHRCTKDTQILLSLCMSLSWDLHGRRISVVFYQTLEQETHICLLNVPDTFQRILVLPQTARVKMKTSLFTQHFYRSKSSFDRLVTLKAAIMLYVVNSIALSKDHWFNIEIMFCYLG